MDTNFIGIATFTDNYLQQFFYKYLLKLFSSTSLSVTVSSEINSESRLSTLSPPLLTSEKLQESTEDTVPADNKSVDGGDQDTNADPASTQDEGFFSREFSNLKSEKPNDLVQENEVDNYFTNEEGESDKVYSCCVLI